MIDDTDKTIKNPKHIQKKIFLLDSTRQVKIDPASFRKIVTEVTAFLPINSKGFITWRFRSEEVNEIFMADITYKWK